MNKYITKKENYIIESSSAKTTYSPKDLNPCPAIHELTRFRYRISQCYSRVYSFLIYANILALKSRAMLFGLQKQRHSYVVT